MQEDSRDRGPDASSATSPLTEGTYHRALDLLAEIDADLAGVLAVVGSPPLWAMEPGFPTLVRIILEQQVSLASARAAFHRLQDRLPALTPAHFLDLDDPALLEIGFSRQKTRYCRALATALLEGALDLPELASLGDDEARRKLTAIPGIGPWTCDIYLLRALLRPDVWPKGDLAIAVSAERLKDLQHRPSPAELEGIARPWRPWRAVAARILWHHYLNGSD